MLLVNLPQDKKSKTLKGKAFRHKLNIAKCIKPDVRFCPSSESKNVFKLRIESSSVV